MTAGPFFWTDLLTDDPDATAAWLLPAMGWQREGNVLRTADRPVAQLLQLGDADSAPHWLLHLAVPDLAALCRRVAFLQGSVLIEPESVPDLGDGAVIADPMGCVLHPFQLSPTHRLDLPDGAAGTLDGALLYAPRVDLGARFYATLTGWERKPGPVWVAAGQAIAAGLEAPKEATAQWLPLFAVAEIEAALARAMEHGARAAQLPTAIAGIGRVAIVEGPDGVMLALRAREAT